MTVKTREIGSRPAAALPEQAPILQYVRAVDAHLGIRSHLDCSSTDANIPLSMGIPAIAIGAGGLGGGAHTSAGMVQSRRPGSGPETNPADPAAAAARPRRGARASEPPEGGTGAALQHHHLGHDVRPGQIGLHDISPVLFLAMRFSLATVALLASVPRHLAGAAPEGATRDRENAGRRGHDRHLSVRRISASDGGSTDHDAAEIGIFHRTGDGDGTFARGARL